MKLRNIKKKEAHNIVGILLYRSMESLEEIKQAMEKIATQESTDRSKLVNQMLLGAYLSHLRVIDGYTHLLKNGENDKQVDGFIEVHKNIIEECYDKGVIVDKDPNIEEVK